MPGYCGKSNPWSKPESSTRGHGFVESDKLIAVSGSGWMHGVWVGAVGCGKSGTAALGVSKFSARQVLYVVRRIARGQRLESSRPFWSRSSSVWRFSSYLLLLGRSSSATSRSVQLEKLRFPRRSHGAARSLCLG